jgi:peptidoglycan glycosyltransferase
LIDQVKRLSIALAVAFAAVVLAASYWTRVRGEGLLARGDNPRRVLDERLTPRGAIEDRNGALLAEAVGNPGSLTRHYPYPALSPLLGYVSPLYGLAGVEAAQDEVLHGGEGVDEFDVFWQSTVLGQPPPGRDIRLTLDLDLQSAADEALGQRPGAVVVLEVRTGHLLALASHPTFDANQLDSAWEELVADPDAPLVHRPTLGLYQPGAALWPLALAAAAEHEPGLLAQVYPDAGQSVPVDDQVLACRMFPGLERLTARESLLFGCPGPLAAIGRALGAEVLAATLAAFQVSTPPVLAIPTTAAEAVPVTDAALAALGYEGWAVTPLRMALVWAAIAGDGAMPAPQLLLATQGLNGIWRPAAPEGQPVQAMTPEAAALVRLLLPQRGYVAVAPAGAGGQTLAWYLDAGPRASPGYVVVVVLESGDQAAAHQIGTRLLAQATAE